MKYPASAFRLYAITRHSDDLKKQVADAIAGGVTMVQIREKNCDTTERIRRAQPVLQLCRKNAVPCILNDDVEAAKQLGADGVHLGQGDMPVAAARRLLGTEFIIGVSAHNPDEAMRAQIDGADYIGCGAVFGSHTKKDASFLPYEMLRQISKTVQIPVVAIGGITLENAHALQGAGIDGIAVVSALFDQQDVTQAARDLCTLANRICIHTQEETT